MCCVTARADMWKNHRWLNRPTSTSKSWNYTGKSWNYTGKTWNYTGTRLNGITHGGGIYETNSYQRSNNQEDNGMMSRKMNYDMSAGNTLNSRANQYNTSFSGEPTRKSNFRIVSSRAFAGNEGRYGRFFAGGTSEEKMYRYGRRNVNYGVPVNSAVIINVEHSAARDADGNVVIDGERRNTAARDDFGNTKGPTGAPFGKMGSVIPFSRYGFIGPAAKPFVNSSPIGDSLMPLLLMAGLLVIKKKKKYIMASSASDKKV